MLRMSAQSPTNPKRHAFILPDYPSWRNRPAFVYRPLGDGNPATAGVTFTVGPDRRASAITLDQLDARGQGTFRRTPARP